MNAPDNRGERIAALEVKVQHLTDEVHELTKTVGELRDTLQQGRGAWWVLMGASGFVGFVLSLAVKFVPFLNAPLPK